MLCFAFSEHKHNANSQRQPINKQITISNCSISNRLHDIFCDAIQNAHTNGDTLFERFSVSHGNYFSDSNVNCHADPNYHVHIIGNSDTQPNGISNYHEQPFRKPITAWPMRCCRCFYTGLYILCEIRWWWHALLGLERQQPVGHRWIIDTYQPECASVC
jgi:hypothetical protein